MTTLQDRLKEACRIAEDITFERTEGWDAVQTLQDAAQTLLTILPDLEELVAAITPMTTIMPWSVTHNSWEVSTVYGASGTIVCELPIDSECDEDTQDEFEEMKEADANFIVTAARIAEKLKKVVG